MKDRNESSERRGFIRKLIGLGGAGAVLGLLEGNVGVPRVEAANGDNLKIGTTNTGTSDTRLQSSSTNAFVGESSSTSGRGLFGSATALSGSTYGVYGQSNSTSGTGVIGFAGASSGTTYGLQGVATSSSGRGVYAYASAGTGTTYAVFAQSNSTSSKAVYALANATSGTTYAVHGQSNSPSGTGVYGYASSGTGTSYGVTGVSASSSGTGVLGTARLESGTTYGVWGQSGSPNGAAVYAQNFAAGGQAVKCQGHVLPVTDNAYNCGDSSKRWKLVRAKTVTPGDLVYENGVRTTEQGSGIAFYNPHGAKIAVLDSEGNFHIKGRIIQDL